MSARNVKVMCPVKGCELIRSPGAIVVHLRRKHGIQAVSGAAAV